MAKKAARPARSFEIETWVAGVTFDNPDGSSRQEIIDRFCIVGSPIDVRLDPKNRHSDTAVGLWTQARGFFGLGKGRQIGFVPEEYSKTVWTYLQNGWTASGRVLKVRRDESVGLTVTIHLDPPTSPAQ
jgi:hypothetical protein